MILTFALKHTGRNFQVPDGIGTEK